MDDWMGTQGTRKTSQSSQENVAKGARNAFLHAAARDAGRMACPANGMWPFARARPNVVVVVKCAVHNNKKKMLALPSTFHLYLQYVT